MNADMNNADVRASRPVRWEAMPWPQLEKAVAKLQARIVKAEKAGKHAKVKALSRILTRSFAGRALAVKRVSGNRGKNTPGVDGITWSTPVQKRNAVDSLTRTGYRAQPLRRVHIPKSNGKKRPLGIPTMKDRAMQALHLLALAPIAECRADTTSFGFRPKRSAADALAHSQRLLSPASGAEWVLEGDIKSCFDHINHAWLEKHVPMDKRILHQWLKCGVMETGTWRATEAGTPQGGIISPVLANLALDGLQLELNRRYRRLGMRNGVKVWRERDGGKSPGVHLVRYADDFIITSRTREVLENEVKPLVVSFLEERGLTLSPDKTAITHIADGFDFLGKTLRKYDGKYHAGPSKKAVKNLMQKVRSTLRRNRAGRADTVVRLLNPILRGWSNYHTDTASRRDLVKAGALVFQALWHWCKRRHRKKGARWIRRKYFARHGGSNWAFFGEQRNGETIWLHQLTYVRPNMHLPIRHDANPFDPEWREYFALRGARKRLSGRCSPYSVAVSSSVLVDTDSDFPPGGGDLAF